MEMEFRLAQRSDVKPEVCQAILDDAKKYSEIRSEDFVKPWEVLNIFINYAEGRITDPQFWIGLDKDKTLVGYMITRSIEEDKRPALFIRQGYIDEKYRGNVVAKFCLDTLETQAKKAGYKFITLQSGEEGLIYGRWIGKYGYKYKATEFRKEI